MGRISSVENKFLMWEEIYEHNEYSLLDEACKIDPYVK